ncbi:hypothetical protein NDU88_009434 [Pleurodeles waltl]|uniref:Uncharacterized protein n=1 Tax=Pleurodeles waltl TaxID=8319 RepID=A0AAV7RYG7_PLEWA|nr:hypothetical protein NDU88_009434 [Pleurodeles waltl]
MWELVNGRLTDIMAVLHDRVAHQALVRKLLSGPRPLPINVRILNHMDRDVIFRFACSQDKNDKIVYQAATIMIVPDYTRLVLQCGQNSDRLLTRETATGVLPFRGIRIPWTRPMELPIGALYHHCP